MRFLILSTLLLLSACATTPGGNVTSESLASSSQLYQQALTAYRSNQLMKAFEAASASLDKNPANARGYELIGLINQRLGRNEAAADAFNKALKLTPDDPGVHNNYGTFLCSQKSYADAQAQYLLAAHSSRNPKPEIAYTNAGLCAKRSGDIDQAKKLFDQAIQQNPGQPTALYQLASISLERNRPVEASTYLDQYLNHAVHTPKTLLLGARIENALGNPAGVESYIQKLRSAFPRSKELAIALALQPMQQKSSPATNRPVAVFDDSWILARDPTHYTLQISSSPNRDTAEAVAKRLAAPTALYVQAGATNIWYNVIHGDFADINTARNALNALKKADPGSQAWVRNFGVIQKRLQEKVPTL